MTQQEDYSNGQMRPVKTRRLSGEHRAARSAIATLLPEHWKAVSWPAMRGMSGFRNRRRKNIRAGPCPITV
jgi:hypothetical protein